MFVHFVLGCFFSWQLYRALEYQGKAIKHHLRLDNNVHHDYNFEQEQKNCSINLGQKLEKQFFDPSLLKKAMRKKAAGCTFLVVFLKRMEKAIGKVCDDDNDACERCV